MCTLLDFAVVAPRSCCEIGICGEVAAVASVAIWARGCNRPRSSTWPSQGRRSAPPPPLERQQAQYSETPSEFFCARLAEDDRLRERWQPSGAALLPGTGADRVRLRSRHRFVIDVVSSGGGDHSAVAVQVKTIVAHFDERSTPVKRAPCALAGAPPPTTPPPRSSPPLSGFCRGGPLAPLRLGLRLVVQGPGGRRSTEDVFLHVAEGC